MIDSLHIVLEVIRTNSNQELLNNFYILRNGDQFCLQFDTL